MRIVLFLDLPDPLPSGYLSPWGRHNNASKLAKALELLTGFDTTFDVEDAEGESEDPGESGPNPERPKA